MDIIEKLPALNHTVGTNEVVKGIKAGRIDMVVFAKNCPEFLVKKIKETKSIEMYIFNGDQKNLGTRLGKPFPVALVGYENKGDHKSVIY
ncbi:MAG: ribosomal L7Ae/L30e/S12e/Gadd45 family protein [Candidatus Aenigmarchaeota archaeon]|nr:ribosomal L7Ae/L30e/S12e/Gadd45 family protein [Candidatus Aenigmarchaeota archaeon]